MHVEADTTKSGKEKKLGYFGERPEVKLMKTLIQHDKTKNTSSRLLTGTPFELKNLEICLSDVCLFSMFSSISNSCLFLSCLLNFEEKILRVQSLE